MNGKGFGVIIFLNLYFVKRSIAIISYAKIYRMHQFIMFGQFDKTL